MSHCYEQQKEDGRIFVPDESTLENTSVFRKKLLLVENDSQLLDYLMSLPAEQSTVVQSVSAREQFDLLYEETEDLFKRVKADKEICELRNMINVGYLITRQAIERKESRGLHYSIDYPKTNNDHPQEVW